MWALSQFDALRGLVALAAVGLLVAALAAPAVPVARAETTADQPADADTSAAPAAGGRVYDRIDYDLLGTVFRSRGYLNARCLSRPKYPCLARSDGHFRREATAQARAVQELTPGATPIASPADPTTWLPLHWEFAPKPDSQHAPEYPSTDRSTGIKQKCSSDKWRIDILRDPNTPLTLVDQEPFISEVKRWEGSSTITAVNEQLNCYETRLSTANPAAAPERENQLRREKWSEAYPASNGDVWCVWGSRTDNGHVYFARWYNTPWRIRDATAGCDGETEERVKQRYNEVNKIAEQFSKGHPLKPLLKQFVVEVVVADFIVTAQIPRQPLPQPEPPSSCGGAPMSTPDSQVPELPELSGTANHPQGKMPSGVACTAEVVRAPGQEMSVTGYVLHERESAECDDASSEVGDDGPHCDYEVVTASDIHTATAFDCHYNDGDEATKAEATESLVADGVTVLNATVVAPGNPGEALVCFRSKETFTGDSGDAPAAGTTVAPFVVLD